MLIAFPFQIENGKIKTEDNTEAKLKRVFEYSKYDLPYSRGVGIGLYDFIFAVGTDLINNGMIRRDIVNSILGIEGVTRANTVVSKIQNGIKISAFYEIEKNNTQEYQYQLTT